MRDQRNKIASIVQSVPGLSGWTPQWPRAVIAACVGVLRQKVRAAWLVAVAVVAAYGGSQWSAAAVAAEGMMRSALGQAWTNGGADPAGRPPPSAVGGGRPQQNLTSEWWRRLGGVEGRLRALELLHAGWAGTTRLSYAAPELARRSWWRNGAQTGFSSAGSRLAALENRLARREDAHVLLRMAKGRQQGMQAGVPTFPPLSAPFRSSSFGWRRHPLSGRFTMHEGVDFAAPHGTVVKAAAGGMVMRAGRAGGYGNMLEIVHGNGLRTRYAHASRLLVGVGDVVRRGQPVARVGSTGRSTGPHLHFEVRLAGYPLEPSLFLSRPPKRAGRPDDALQSIR